MRGIFGRWNNVGEIGGEIGKERVLGGLLKSGQTTQYGGYEDDGYFEKGLSKQYTVLTAGQYALTTGITLNAKTDAHSNNCVYDQRTKLTWSRYHVATVGPASDGQLPWTTNANGEGIFSFVAAANVAKLAGYSDWRIPNERELPSLLNMEATAAVPDEVAFPGWVYSNDTWSSTTSPSVITAAITQRFFTGLKIAQTKTLTFYVALVRGG